VEDHDVDLDHDVLMIQHSKGRSRIVAMRADLVAELRRCIADCERLEREHPRADAEGFFLRLDGSPLTIVSVSAAIRRLLRDLGIKPARGRVGARPYEFRHAFRASTYGLGRRRCGRPGQAATVISVSWPPEPHRHRGLLECDAAVAGIGQSSVRGPPAQRTPTAMSKAAAQALFALVESFFADYLPS
jgi:hypothetical protein